MGIDTDMDTYFFKSSTDLYSRSICLARSMSAASARMQMDMRGRGKWGSLHRHREIQIHKRSQDRQTEEQTHLTVPEKRLSRCGS